MVLVNGNASLLITVSQRLSLATHDASPRHARYARQPGCKRRFGHQASTSPCRFLWAQEEPRRVLCFFEYRMPALPFGMAIVSSCFSHHPYPEAESGPRRSRNTPPEREQRSLSTTLTGCQECQTPDAKGKKKVVAFGGGQQRSPSLRSSVVEGEPAGITIP